MRKKRTDVRLADLAVHEQTPRESQPLSAKGVKVHDRRMFTRTGELREEFRQLQDAERAAAAAPPAERPQPSPAEPVPPPPAAAPPRGRPPIAATPAAAPPSAAGYPDREATGGPGFMDLIGLLAEPASLYLREAGAAGHGTLAANAKAEQSLELARLHIDLLAVVQEKTAGNLGAQEKAMLDDVVYRLQMGYVEMTR
jgi:Domain of unknown function (DUF1844)